MRYFYISLPYATFGIITENSIVRAAAPIASWMVGRSLHYIKPWLIKKEAIVAEMSISM